MYSLHVENLQQVLAGVVLLPGESLPLRITDTTHLTLFEAMKLHNGTVTTLGSAVEETNSPSEMLNQIGVLLRPDGARRTADGEIRCRGLVGTAASVVWVNRLFGQVSGEDEIIAVCYGSCRFIVTGLFLTIYFSHTYNNLYFF